MNKKGVAEAILYFVALIAFFLIIIVFFMLFKASGTPNPVEQKSITSSGFNDLNLISLLRSEIPGEKNVNVMDKIVEFQDPADRIKIASILKDQVLDPVFGKLGYLFIICYDTTDCSVFDTVYRTYDSSLPDYVKMSDNYIMILDSSPEANYIRSDQLDSAIRAIIDLKDNQEGVFYLPTHDNKINTVKFLYGGSYTIKE